MKTVFTALLVALLVFPFDLRAGQAPDRGMAKVQVRQQYGEPENRRAPVGQPPISRWSYPDFTVYFENDLVLHSVRDDRPRPAPPATDDDDGERDDDDVRDQPERSRDPDSDESDTAPASTAVRAQAEPGTQRNAEAPGDNQPAARTERFRFDPASGRIVVDGEAAGETDDADQ